MTNRDARPKISVVMPVYNGVPFVSKTVQCVLDQTYPAHEIIVVDDGSTDASPEALRYFGDKIIAKRTANGGISAARNTGMSLATGDWIAFVDHDDFWFKNKLAVQADFISKYPEIGFFSCNYVVRHPIQSPRLVKAFSALPHLKDLNFDAPLSKDAFGLLVNENFIGCPSAVVVRRTVADKAGPFKNYPYAQDYDYWLKCAQTTNFVLISEVLCIKKTHDKNTSNDRAAVFLDHKRVLTDIRAAFPDVIARRGLGVAFRDAIGAVCYELGNAYYDLGQRKHAIQLYLEGLASSLSWINFMRFMGVVFRKSLRAASFGLLRRKRFKRWT